jgi:flagellar motor component MotA
MFRRVTRVAKEDYEIMDEIVEAIMHGLTPEQIRKELEDMLYEKLERMTQAQLEEELEKHGIELYHEPAEWED